MLLTQVLRGHQPVQYQISILQLSPLSMVHLRATMRRQIAVLQWAVRYTMMQLQLSPQSEQVQALRPSQATMHNQPASRLMVAQFIMPVQSPTFMQTSQATTQASMAVQYSMRAQSTQ